MSSQRERAMKPTDLRGILRYVPMFRDHVFVIAVDGSIVSHENFANIVTDIAVLRSLSIKVVLVHGIGQQLVGLAGEHNIALSDIQGEGPTDVSTMSLAREASALVSQSVLENLSQAGLRCAITNAVRSTKIGRLKGVDHLYTGKVEKVDAAILKSMLSQDILPLVTPIVCDREGQSLRVNSDHLAMELAVALGASKLIYLTPFSGLQVNGVVQLNLPEDDLKRLLADKHAKLDPRIRSKAVQAAKALDNDVPRAHILDGRVFGCLLTEIFDKVGLGTMVHANDYDRIRQAKKKDAQALYNLAKHGAKTDALVARTRQQRYGHGDRHGRFTRQAGPSHRELAEDTVAGGEQILLNGGVEECRETAINTHGVPPKARSSACSSSAVGASVNQPSRPVAPMPRRNA